MSRPPLARSRAGSLDVPLSVWTVEGPGDLLDGLLIELAPTGPLAAVDTPGWTALPLAGRTTRLYWRTRTSYDLARTLPDAARGRTNAHHVTSATLAAKLDGERRLGMIAASAWLLRSPGALDAAARALRPGGFLAVIGRTEQDAVDIATRTDTDAPAASRLDFTAYLVAASTAAFNAAVRVGDRAAGASMRHWAVGIWQRRTPAGGARG
ncbi:hypothetical protein AB0A73_22220 [Glycomyces sp. NPDC047369]